jgi:hypothetical protein
LVLAGWSAEFFSHGLHLDWLEHQSFVLRNWVFLMLYLGVFALQIVSAMMADGLRWRRYPVLLLMVPIYPLYFWCLLFTGYFAGFVKGFLRRDSGRWRRTIRAVEIGK